MLNNEIQKLVEKYGEKTLYLAVSPLPVQNLEKFMITNDVFSKNNVILIADESFTFIAGFQLIHKQIKIFKKVNGKLKVNQGKVT